MNKFYYFLDMKFYNSREERQKWLSWKFKDVFNSSNSVLDVGCWDATTKQYLPKKLKYMGIDIGGKPDIKVDLDSVKKLPFKEGEFDVVLCSDVLEHLENIHLITEELFRVSSKSVIITLPNPSLGFWNYLFKQKNKKNKKEFGKYLKFYGLPLERPIDRHRWFFSYDEAIDFINYWAKKSGFKLKLVESELENKKVNFFKTIIRYLISKINKNFVVGNIIFHLEKNE